jgi:hypothetical protein
MRPRAIWIGEQSVKGYVEWDFKEAFRRYIPKTAMQRLLDDSVAAKREREQSQGTKQGGVDGGRWMMDGE